LSFIFEVEHHRNYRELMLLNGGRCDSWKRCLGSSIDVPPRAAETETEKELATVWILTLPSASSAYVLQRDLVSKSHPPHVRTRRTYKFTRAFNLTLDLFDGNNRTAEALTHLSKFVSQVMLELMLMAKPRRFLYMILRRGVNATIEPWLTIRRNKQVDVETQPHHFKSLKSQHSVFPW
jgi:hypothetical protein